jgi:hypothetical protein
MFTTTLQQNFSQVEHTLRVLNIQGKELFEAGNKKIYEEGGIMRIRVFLMFSLFPSHMVLLQTTLKTLVLLFSRSNWQKSILVNKIR